MITRLYLEQFRSFQQAELLVDNLTLLVGTNASGKSNVFGNLIWKPFH